jgi:hypothetical protein
MNSYKDRKKGNHRGEVHRMNIIRYEVVKFKFKFPGIILELTLNDSAMGLFFSPERSDLTATYSFTQLTRTMEVPSKYLLGQSV